MSVAARFKFEKAFPWCVLPSPYTSADGYDYVGGLTLAEAMDFFWNIEDTQFVTAGVCEIPRPFPLPPLVADISGAFNFDSPIITGCYTDPGITISTGIGAMTRDYSGLITGLPSSTTEPYERVCERSVFNALLGFGMSGPSFPNGLVVDFPIYTFQDPTDPELCALYYRFEIQTGEFSNAIVSFRNPSNSPGSSSGSYTTGTFDIGGFTFDWRCYYNTSLVGESLVVNTYKYTYPP